jgi:hypothetical protein
MPKKKIDFIMNRSCLTNNHLAKMENHDRAFCVLIFKIMALLVNKNPPDLPRGSFKVYCLKNKRKIKVE